MQCPPGDLDHHSQHSWTAGTVGSWSPNHLECTRFGRWGWRSRCKEWKHLGNAPRQFLSGCHKQMPLKKKKQKQKPHISTGLVVNQKLSSASLMTHSLTGDLGCVCALLRLFCWPLKALSELTKESSREVLACLYVKEIALITEKQNS